MSDQFIVHRLRAKPVEYNLNIRHFVIDGEWVMGVTITDVDIEIDEEARRVADDLRRAADMIERDRSLASAISDLTGNDEAGDTTPSAGP
jgi:hypothetical protein